MPRLRPLEADLENRTIIANIKKEVTSVKLLRRIKNNVWYIFAGIGFITILLSASASDAGASLQAVIPPAVAGVLTMGVGIVRGNQTAERRRKEMQVAKRRHGMKLMTMQKEADERYEKSV